MNRIELNMNRIDSTGDSIGYHGAAGVFSECRHSSCSSVISRLDSYDTPHGAIHHTKKQQDFQLL